MDSVLLISSSEKSTAFFTELLKALPVNKIVNVPTCGEARRALLDFYFDLCIINAPLLDETGEELAIYIASKWTCQVILVVKSMCFEAISANVEDTGVITVSKPTTKDFLWNTLKLTKAAHSRINRMQSENIKLTQKIEDIRVVDRAKCMLISHHNMTENEAHKYIEKQAMNLRITKKAVAEGILKAYEN